MLPNVNVIKRLAQTSEAQEPTDVSQSWTNFLIGLFGIAGSEPVADAMAVDANQLAWWLWTWMIDIGWNSASPTVEAGKGSEPCYQRQSWKRSRCSGVMSADQSQERIITKSCNHVKLQKLGTTMTYSAVGLTAVVGTNWKWLSTENVKTNGLKSLNWKSTNCKTKLNHSNCCEIHLSDGFGNLEFA